MAEATPSGSIHGRRVRKDKGVEIIRREALQDERISFKAQGILTYLLSLPDTWKTNSERLSTLRKTKGKVKEGRESIRAGLRELEEAGYLRRERKLVDGRWAWEWRYTDDPADLISGSAPDQQVTSITAGRDKDGLPVHGTDQHKQGVSAGRDMDGLSVDGSPVDIETREGREPRKSFKDKDSSGDDAVASAPPRRLAGPRGRRLRTRRRSHGPIHARTWRAHPEDPQHDQEEAPGTTGMAGAGLRTCRRLRPR